MLNLSHRLVASRAAICQAGARGRAGGGSKQISCLSQALPRRCPSVPAHCQTRLIKRICFGLQLLFSLFSNWMRLLPLANIIRQVVILNIVNTSPAATFTIVAAGGFTTNNILFRQQLLYSTFTYNHFYYCSISIL